MKQFKKESPSLIEIDLEALCFAMENSSFCFYYVLETASGEVKEKSDIPVGSQVPPAQLEGCYRIPQLSSEQILTNMRGFPPQVPAVYLREQLEEALQAAHPERSFLKVLDNHPEYRIRWEAFHLDFFKNQAISWLASLDLRYRLKSPPLSAEERIKRLVTRQEETLSLLLEGVVNISSVIHVALVGTPPEGETLYRRLRVLIFLENLEETPRLARLYRRILNREHAELLLLTLDKEGQYQGQICFYENCPARAVECSVSGCGKIPYIRRLNNFVFNLNQEINLGLKELYCKAGQPGLLWRLKDQRNG